MGRVTFLISGATVLGVDSAEFVVETQDIRGYLLTEKDIGDWTVCFQRPGEGAVEIPAVEGHFALTVFPTEQETLPPRGLFRSIQTTVEAGRESYVFIPAERLLVPSAYPVGFSTDCATGSSILDASAITPSET